MDNLQKARIKASTLEDLNDPFEFNTISFNHSVMRVLWSTLRKEVFGNAGIFCFSQSWNNPVIWSHYADNHKGIALGFEVPDETLLKVNYRKTPLRFSKATLEDPDTPSALAEIQEKLELSATTKFKHWEYEDEARVIGNKADLISEGGRFFLPFGETLKLKEVVIGAQSLLSSGQILEAASSRPKIVTSRLAFQTFSVVPQRSLQRQK